MWACAESLGLTLKPRSRFRVWSAWGSSLSHRFIGKLGGVEHRPAMKWFLNVWIALSALLRRWRPDGVSWNLMYWSCMNTRSMSDTSLSNRSSSGLRPRLLSILMLFWYARSIWCFVLDGIGISSM